MGETDGQRYPMHRDKFLIHYDNFVFMKNNFQCLFRLDYNMTAQAMTRSLRVSVVLVNCHSQVICRFGDVRMRGHTPKSVEMDQATFAPRSAS